MTDAEILDRLKDLAKTAGMKRDSFQRSCDLAQAELEGIWQAVNMLEELLLKRKESAQ